ncbi:MAG: hypothetical protein RBT63_03155 [Bdellovibrionales bacterium]|jgi:hypothetical protein|nr:hypothetical protein [Bdellovibrionales bacterium]
MSMNRIWKPLLVLPLLLILTACETEEDRQISGAQDCIDAAKDEADADRCFAMVNGNNSEKAYLIRCSASYIAQGFTGNRFADAFQKLKDGDSTGQDPMATAMAYLVFAKNLPKHTAETTLENCKKSGVRSLVRLATMSSLSTYIAQTVGGPIPDPMDPNFDPSQYQAAIDTLANAGTEEQQKTVGGIAIQAHEAYCNEGSSFESNEICQHLNSALATGGGDRAAIGQQLLALLKN